MRSEGYVHISMILGNQRAIYKLRVQFLNLPKVAVDIRRLCTKLFARV